MWTTLPYLLLFYFCSESCNGQWPDPRVHTYGLIWPQPQNINYLNYTWDISSDKFIFITDKPKCDIIELAVIRYQHRLFARHYTLTDSGYYKNGQMYNLTITVKDGCTSNVPQFGMDESYKLDTQNSAAHLIANQVWGILRGLESFAQLFYEDENGTLKVRAAVLNDYPRYLHRGVLLDTSRHYLSVNVIKANIELMAQNKFNTFHWHIVDLESFPYKSQVYPELIKGAYTPRHVYTIKTIKDIINYARLRGIRVLPEFDTPGHTKSWGIGAPYILARCFDPSGNETHDRGLLDPTKEETWDFLNAFFEEIFDVFPDHYFHLGGDEAEFWLNNCWQNNPNITQFMQLYGLRTVVDLEGWYFDQLFTMFDNQRRTKRKKFLVWEEAIGTGVREPGLIAHIWKSEKMVEELVKKGYYTILSSCWYLNDISTNADWMTYYKCDPRGFNGSRSEYAHVLGGEAALWGEWVDNTNAISRLWPRASAVGERLWSDIKTDDTQHTWPRLYEMQCRMAAQGYPVQPGYGPGYCDYEYQMKLPI